jgi:RimJ/RimL family protein N-acetyltransferase
MKFGIRRRTIDLVPPSDDDVEWVFASGGSESEKTRAAAKSAYRAGKFVIGVIRRNNDDKRVGYVLLIPSSLIATAGGNWDFTIMIPDPADRDLFSAVHACDAISHYMFDFGKIKAAIWRIREDNVRAQLLGKRFGYPSQGMVEEGGHRYHLFLLDRDMWRERKAKLEERAKGPAFEELRK